MRRSLSNVARRAAAAAGARGLAAESAVQETNAFTRFSSPVPTQFTHTSILGQPPTQARGVQEQGGA